MLLFAFLWDLSIGGAVETRDMGIIAIIAGILVATGAIYMLIKPMIILGDELISFKSGNISGKKEIAYSEIASWLSSETKKKQPSDLKGEKEETQAENKQNRIVINYFNLDEKNQLALIGQLNKKGVEQAVVSSRTGKVELKKK